MVAQTDRKQTVRTSPGSGSGDQVNDVRFDPEPYGALSQLPDTDPEETREWLENLTT